MATYKRASGDIMKLIVNVIKLWHKPLEDAGVKLSVLTAWPPLDENDQPKGRPIIHQGIPVLAYVKICSLKSRVQGVGDAEMIIDGPGWNDMNAAKKKSLIDHELEHLKIVFDSENTAKTDGEGRPKMKMRLHDWELGGFNDVAKRNGTESHEADAIRGIFESDPQMFFAFVGDHVPRNDKKKKGNKDNE